MGILACTEDTCGSIGVYTTMLVENSETVGDPCPPATFDNLSERYEILRESLTYTDKLLGGAGLTGTLDPIGIHVRHAARVVVGQIEMEVGPFELAAWLPRILGNANVGTTFATSETFDLRPFDIMLKRDQGTVIYRHCAVRAATFNSVASIGGQEQVMRMTLDIIGYEEHDATYPLTPPSLPSTPRLYWLLGDSEFLLNGTEYYIDSFSLKIDNKLVPRVRNFLQTTCIQSHGRDITLRVPTPYTATSHSDLYIAYYEGNGTLSFLSSKSPETPAAYSTVVSFPDLRSTRRTPVTTGPDEIPLWVDLKAFRSGANEPISIVNVSA